MRHLLFFIFSFLPVFITQAQQCPFDSLVLERRADWLEQNQLIETYLAQTKTQVALRAKIVIPVVVHIIWKKEAQNISDMQIYSQLDALNRDFSKANNEARTVPSEFQQLVANVGIEFCLASTTPTGQPTNGITRTQTDFDEIGNSSRVFYTSQGGMDAWDTNRYLNIWVCELPEWLLGLGSPPGIAPPEEDGVVIDHRYFGTAGAATHEAPYNLGRTLTHEIGHYLGLLHPWGLLKGDCDEDDLVADTPVQFGTYKDCPGYPQSSCGTNDMTMNFMNETDDACMAFFTTGQKERMLATLDSFRPDLAGNTGCYEEETLDFPLRIFPNPADYVLNVKVDVEGPVRLLFIDISGRILLEIEIPGGEIVPVDISKLPSGLFFVSAKCNETGTIKTAKLIIVK